MANKRVRLNDANNPLSSSTDRVLASFEQVSKTTSQPDVKLTKQEDNNPATEEVNNLESQKDKKLVSQESSKLNLEEAGNSTSQEAAQSESQQDSLSAIQQSNNPSIHKFSNSPSQKVDISASQPDNNLSVQQFNKSETKEDSKLAGGQDELAAGNQDSKLTSQEVRVSGSDEQNSNLALQEVNKSGIQPANQLIKPSEENSDSNNLKLNSLNDSNLTREQVDKLASQQVKSEKATCRKSTFQINEEVLNLLDKLHLTLQLELGKANAPYKEVIVEEALVRLLEQVSCDRSGLTSVLLERQKSR